MKTKRTTPDLAAAVIVAALGTLAFALFCYSMFLAGQSL